VAGEVTKGIGVAGMAVSTLAIPGTVPVLIVSQAINGLGFCMTAGTDSGMLHQLVCHLGAEQHYRDLETRTQSYGFIAFLSSGVIGGLTASLSISVPLLLTVAATLIGAASVVFFRAPAPTHDRAVSEASGSPSASGAEARAGAAPRHLRDSWGLIVFYALTRGVILTLFVWVVPVSLFVRLHVAVAYFGLILGLYTLTGFIAARYSKAISTKLGEQRLLLSWIPALLIAGILLLLANLSALYVVIPVIIGLPAAFVRPLTYAAVARQAPAQRAEVISAAEMVLGIVNAGLVVIAAVIEQSWRDGPAVVLLGLVALAASVGWLAHRTPATIEMRQASVPTDA
jgi:hypothetical protein